MATDDFSRYLNSTSSSEWFSTGSMNNADRATFDNPASVIEVLAPSPRDEVMKWLDEPFKFEEVKFDPETIDEEDSSEKVMFDPENLVL